MNFFGTRSLLDAEGSQRGRMRAALCVVGGLIGLTFAYAMCFAIAAAFPSFPVQFSIGLVLIGMFVSVFTGLISGFAPAWSASRLDPVTALRYE